MKIDDGSISRKDQIWSLLGIAILLIGSATGNAIAMVVMSLAGLALMTAVYRKQLGAGFFIAALATASAAVTAFVIGRFMSIK